MEQGFDIGAILAALKRRWLVIVAPVIVLTPIAVGVAYILPPIYSATARVLVETQQIPEALAQSTVAVGVGERIALIEQRLMSRQNLLDIARRFDVTRGMPEMSPSEIVQMMRESASIQGVRLTGARGPVSGINITFNANRAALSAQVANEFLSLVLEQNIQQRTGRAFETSAYFREETARLSAEIAKLEQNITDFKIANEEALPESLNFRRTELARLQQQLFERELRQIELEEQKKQLQEAVRRGDFNAVGRELTPEEIELGRLRLALVQRRSVYSETHPTVRALQAQIATLEARLSPSDVATTNDAGDDPRASAIATQVTRTTEAIDAQIETLVMRREEESARVATLIDSIERTPSVELELGRLEREYGALQTQYREAVLKLAQAETGERLEVNQQAERFEVIERAETPSRPATPNRPMIIAAGVAGSLGLGFALAVLLELLNKRIRTMGDLENQLGLRPVVTIPYIETEREIRRRKWTIWIVALLIIVVTPVTLYLIDQYYQPLPVLGERIMKIVGIEALVTMIETRMGR